MKISKIQLEDNNLTFFLNNYNSGEDFGIIDRLLRDIEGVNRMKKLITPLALIYTYKYRNGEFSLITDEDFGTYLTVEKKGNEKILEEVIKIINNIPNLDKYQPLHRKAIQWLKSRFFTVARH